MKGAWKGMTKEGAMRDRASEVIRRGAHLTAGYLASFHSFQLCLPTVVDTIVSS